jgi:hypothetical protein
MSAIAPTELRTALAAVSQARHTHIGIRAAGSRHGATAEPDAPAALLADRSAYAFSNAQVSASEMYPDARQFEVVGSDYIYPGGSGPGRIMIGATPLATYYITPGDEFEERDEDSGPDGGPGLA